MPNMTVETIHSQTPRRPASRHGIHNCRTETLDISAFTKNAHHPDGYIRSGQPVAEADGLLVPYNPHPTARRLDRSMSSWAPSTTSNRWPVPSTSRSHCSTTAA